MGDTVVDRAADAARVLHDSPIRGSTHGRILRAIAQRVGGGARRELADQLSVSAATVTRAITLMIKEGLVQEGRHQPVGLGRPVAPLTLSRELAMIGIAVTPERGKPGTLLGTVCHLDGSPVAGFEAVRARPVGDAARVGRGAFVDELQAFASQLRTASLLNDDQILGCGITIGGYVDGAGDIQKAYGGAWSSVDEPVSIRGVLQERLRLPVVVGNDTTSLVVRKNLRPGQPSDNYMLLISIDYGVGGAVVVNNRSWSGAHGMAGEPGHLPTTGVARIHRLPDEDAAEVDDPALVMPSCQCETDAADLEDDDSEPDDRRRVEPAGHAEAFASPHAIERRAKENGLTESYRPVAELASRPRSDRKVALLFYQGGVALGRTVVSGINWLDPQRVVVYLPADMLHVPNEYLAGHYYLRGLRDEVRKNSFVSDVEDVVSIRGLPLDVIHEKLASAAAYLVLRRLFRLVNGEDPMPPA